MLSSILWCLSSEFDLSKEQDLVQEYLSALTHLERFNVIKSFMPQQDKNSKLIFMNYPPRSVSCKYGERIFVRLAKLSFFISQNNKI